MNADERLAELGLELPAPPVLPFTPRLVPVVVQDGLAFLSGAGVLDVTGYVGGDVSLEQAYDAARRTALDQL
ncbi:MAG TPA: hypothetical protein VIU44_07020, partial [Gaiellaceae bacterium]